MSEQYKRNPNTKCKVCLFPIYRRPTEIKTNGKNVFCSAKCYGLSLRKESPCIICGKPIPAGLNKKTCSRKCSNINRTGTKYKIGRPKDKATSLRIIKIQLIELRGNKCERCSYQKTEVLQVHHKNRDHSDNRIENLEIICPNCHYEEHYLYGGLLNS